MSNANVRLDMTADGKPIEALQRLIADRIKYTNETAKQSLAACAIQILISLRAATTVANPKNVRIEMNEEAQLYPSFMRHGGAKIPCLRFLGSNARYVDAKTRVLWKASKGIPFKSCHVYSFVDFRGQNSREYMVVAPDIDTARNVAVEKIQRRINAHKGLAKLALGKLMNKAANTTKSFPDQVTADTIRLSDANTRATSSSIGGFSSGEYSLTCYDDLDYAILALRGGQADVDMALMKAANKIASVIKRKVGDQIFAPHIETPFPEIRRNK